MSDTEFWRGFERHARSVAIDRETGGTVSYARLAQLAEEFAAQLPSNRQLVALEARNEVEAIAAYLGCLRHRHPVILLNTEAIVDGRILSEYEPNWLYSNGDGSWCLKRLSDRTDTVFSDELAVLLSTSGTTGAPKLVRLSFDNIASNAGAIADYLRIMPDDCAVTTLDFCYSYGLSVLNSHFSAGARILLTDRSVVSDGFWTLFASKGATSLALVPYHFELLDRVDFAAMDLPTLRYVTQAGGKLQSDSVTRYGRLAKRKGWLFYVMYGQTEASPRMSYVPPEELLANVDSIGRAIPGGELLLIDHDGAEITGAGRTGELVYRGPNVMLGYAECRADLAKPRDTHALRTGDLAQRQENGYFKIVSRLNRFIKLYGLRVNLDEVEGRLRGEGFPVYCTGNDRTLALFHTGELNDATLKTLVHDRYNIQAAHIYVKRIADVPQLSSGKVDYRALAQLIEEGKPHDAGKLTVRAIFAEALGDEDLDDSRSFTEIGGDSLAYLTISLRLEESLGFLPDDWERLSVRELERLKPARSGFISVPVDTIVRNLAILSVVLNHLMLTTSDGGAIALIMLVGFSLAKYDSHQLSSGRLGGFLASKLSRILGLYYVIVISYFIVTWGRHGVADAVPWLLLVPNYRDHTDALFAYWFIGAYAQLILIVALVWQLPTVRRLFSERKMAFGYVALALSYVAVFVTEREIPALLWPHNTFSIMHVCVLGWCAYFAKTIRDKVLVSAAVIVAVALFWSNPEFPFNVWYFDFFFLASCLAVTWSRRVPVPRAVGTTLMWLASISFFLYIMHVIPVLAVRRLAETGALSDVPVAAGVGLVVSVILAVLAARFMALIEARLRRLWARRWSPGRATRQAGQP